jgi:hypothetical protein
MLLQETGGESLPEWILLRVSIFLARSAYSVNSRTDDRLPSKGTSFSGMRLEPARSDRALTLPASSDRSVGVRNSLRRSIKIQQLPDDLLRAVLVVVEYETSDSLCLLKIVEDLELATSSRPVDLRASAMSESATQTPGRRMSGIAS